MIDLTKTYQPTDLARAILTAQGKGAIFGHLETAANQGLEMAFVLPPFYGQSAEWYLDNEASLSQGKAILFGDDGLEAQLPWGQFRKDANVA